MMHSDESSLMTICHISFRTQLVQHLGVSVGLSYIFISLTAPSEDEKTVISSDPDYSDTDDFVPIRSSHDEFDWTLTKVDISLLYWRMSLATDGATINFKNTAHKENYLYIRMKFHI